MSVVRGHRGRVDRHHGEWMAEAARLGWSALSLAPLGNGAPDALLARGSRLVLAEFKTGAAALTPDEQRWHRSWRGEVAIVRSLDDLVQLLTERAR